MPATTDSSPSRDARRARPRARARARAAAAFAPLLFLLLAGGCGAHTKIYRGVPAATVWAAAQAASESPDYDADDLARRWNVDRNSVLVVEDESQMHVFRELSRLQMRPRGDRFVERRTWKLGISLGTDGSDPTLTVVSRGAAWPAHVQEEAERYFAQVDELLDPSAASAPER
jgi:hypothetical protein